MPWPILLMCRELDLGGTERQLTEIAKSLDRSRFEVHVAAYRPQGFRGDELRLSGIRVVEFPIRSYRSVAALRGIAVLANYIRRHRIALVHTWDYPTSVFAIPVARVFTTAVALKSQRAHRSLIPGLYGWLERLSDRMAHGIVVNCEFLRGHMQRDEHFSRPIHVCYNGIDLDRFFPLPGPRRPELQAGSLVIGTVCVLRPEKDLAALIQAFASVRMTHAGLKLVTVGSGSMLGELKALTRSLEIESDCLFISQTEQIPEWLRSMDIFVMPSRSEALSNAVMEAMACGCAVVASRVGGNPELVTDGETGLLFEAGDAAQLSSALCRLIEDDALRRNFSAAASEMIRTKFSISASAHRMGEIYAQMLRAR